MTPTRDLVYQQYRFGRSVEEATQNVNAYLKHSNLPLLGTMQVLAMFEEWDVTHMFVVNGVTGAYSEKEEWPVYVFVNRETAREFCDLCNDYVTCLETVAANNGKDLYTSSDAPLKHKYDPHFRYDYTGTDYFMTAVKVGPPSAK